MAIKKKKKAPEPVPSYSAGVKLFLLLICLFAAFVSAFKLTEMGYSFFPQPPPNTWVIEYKLSIKSEAESGRIMVFVPGDEPNQRVVEEQVLALGHSYQLNDLDLNRVLEVTTRGGGGPSTIYYRAVVEINRNAPEITGGETPDEEAQKAESIERWLLLSHRTEGERQELQNLSEGIVQDVKGKSHKARLIFDHIVRSFEDERSPDRKGLIRIMRTHRGSIEGRTGLFIDLCRAQNIPARRVVGVDLEGPQKAEVFPWAEVYVKKRWIPVDLKGKSFGELPQSFLAIFRGDSLFVSTREVEKYSYVIHSLNDRLGTEESYQKEFTGLASFFDNISLRRLPLETQKLLGSILLVPLAALMVCFFRVAIGFETIGTFLPVILSLSFKTTDLGLGLIIVSMVILLGVLLGKLFDMLRLPKIPRASLMVTIIVIIMTGLCVAGETLGIYRITNVALFPIVIMTLLVERLSMYWTQYGMGKTMKAYAGTAFVAALGFLIIDFKFLQNIFFNFPELLLINIVLIAITGTYGGSKLIPILAQRFSKKNIESPQPLHPSGA